MITVPTRTASALDYVIDGNGNKLLGSDGSVDIISGARASAFCVQVGGRWFGGAVNFLPSQYSTSYQSKLEGIKLTLTAINETAATDGLYQYVDNIQTVNNINEPFFTSQQILSPEADIILACHKFCDEANTSTNLEWLCTHQDKDKRKEDRPPPVQMDIDMDDSCKNEQISNRVINSSNKTFATICLANPRCSYGKGSSQLLS